MSDKSKLNYLIDAEKKRMEAFSYYVMLTGDSNPTRSTIDMWALKKTAVRYNFDGNDLLDILIKFGAENK